MASTLFSPCHKSGINATLKGLEKIKSIYLSGAHQLYDSHIWWILKPHGARQVSGGVGAKLTTKRNNFGFKITHLSYPEKYFL
jgi:nicotinic acid phosphoribosyltransferase